MTNSGLILFLARFVFFRGTDLRYSKIFFHSGGHLRGGLIRKCLSLICAAFSAVAFPAADAGGEEAAKFILRPGITLSEEYDDNIFLTPIDRVEDYITRIIPSILLQYKTDRWDWDLNYAFDYRYYQRAKKDDPTYVVDLKTRTDLIKNYFIVKVNDEYGRVSLDVTRDFANESLFVNQSDRNVFTLNPYVVLEPGSRSSPVIGYSYVNTWYQDPTAIDTIEHIGYAEMKTLLSSRTTFTTGASYTRGENRLQNFDRTDIYTGPKYDYAQNSYIFIKIGNSWFNLGDGTHVTQPFWDAGITHQYSTLTASFETSLSYFPDPQRVLRRVDGYVASIRKNTERFSLTVSGGLTEYRGAITKHLEDTLYSLSGILRYALTPRSAVALDLTTERSKDHLAGTTRDLYLNGVRLEHRAMKKVTVVLGYRYANSYSPEVFSDNYYDNRVSFEIKGSF